MLKRNHLLFALLILTVGFFIGCSDDSPSGPDSGDLPEFQAPTVDIPQAMKSSNDPGAIQTVAYVQMANSFNSYLSFFNPPAGALSKSTASQDDDWSYNWNVNDESGQYTVTLTVNRTDEGTEWKVAISGTMEGRTVNNWVFIQGEQTADGKNGKIYVFNPELAPAAVLVFEVTNAIDANNIHLLTFLSPEDFKLVLTSNPDSSGDLIASEWLNGEFIKEFTSNWNSSGAGSWISYNKDGTPDEQGSWGG